MELMKFTSLESEIEYLIRNLNKNELLSVVKNDNNLQTITTNLRRSITLKVILNQYSNEKATSFLFVGLYVFRIIICKIICIFFFYIITFS